MLDQLADVDRKTEQTKLVLAELAIDDTVFALRSRFKSSKGVILDFGLRYKNLSPVKVGLESFMSVLENLMQNAFDAVSGGGLIRVTARSTSSECIIIVEDDGCGVDENFVDRLFLRGATNKTGGTGLGLYNCRSSVESWGGSLSFERRTPGTAFIIHLPLTQTGVHFVGLAPALELKIIDDDPSVAIALRAGGYRVLEAVETFDAGRALLATPGSPNDVTLVDYRLDLEKRGTDLINEFRSRPGTLLLCTNDFDDEELIKKAKALGTKIFPKPLCFSIQANAKKD